MFYWGWFGGKTEVGQGQKRQNCQLQVSSCYWNIQNNKYMWDTKWKFDKYWNNLHTTEKPSPILKIDFQGKHQLSRHQLHSTDTCWEMEQSVYKGVRLMLSRIIIYKRQIDMIMMATCWVVTEQSKYLISFECQCSLFSYHTHILWPRGTAMTVNMARLWAAKGEASQIGNTEYSPLEACSHTLPHNCSSFSPSQTQV